MLAKSPKLVQLTCSCEIKLWSLVIFKLLAQCRHIYMYACSEANFTRY